MADVQLKQVIKDFGKTRIIHGVDLSIRDKELIVFVGPSGCGKSTLLRLIAGLEDVSAGELYINNELVNAASPKERGIAMVFQSYALYPHMSVYENMAFGLELSKFSKAEIRSKVEQAAHVLELTDLLERKPKQLSGGQRQRVAIGRAIVRNPQVFLFDEPLSNLDAALRVQMRIEIARLHREMEATMVYVTHDQTEAMTLADRIVVLNAGRIEQVGAPLELYHHPRNAFVAGFIGSPRMNFLQATTKEVLNDGVVVTLSDGTQTIAAVDGSNLKSGDPLTIGVRPEHLTIATDGNLEGKIEVIEELGESHLVHVRLDNREMVSVLGRGDAQCKIGETCSIRLEAHQMHGFTNDGTALRRLRTTCNKQADINADA